MKKDKLSVKTIESKKTKGYYSDGGNLYLRITPNLTKSWAFIYLKDKKRTEIGLGAYSDVSLKEARYGTFDKETKKLIKNGAAQLNKLLSAGIDPLTEKQRLNNELKANIAKSMTFKQCADAYINSKKAGWKNTKHIQQWENTLAQYAFPVFGDLDVKSIDTGLITKCLESIWLTKNETAGRVRGRIEAILDYAKVNKWRKGENPARWKGNLDKLLPKQSDIQKVEHHRALPYAQIHEFINLLRSQEGIAAKCLEFTILTVARTGESIGATWDEIDFSTKTWTIPAERMKMKKGHTVPLSTQALAILNEMSVIRTNDYVFPNNEKGLSNMAMLKLLNRMGKTDITVHGFRSTFRDWAAEKTAYTSEVCEMALAHTIKNQAEAAYLRGELLEKRQRLMDDWQRYCNTRPASGEVIEFKKIG